MLLIARQLAISWPAEWSTSWLKSDKLNQWRAIPFISLNTYHILKGLEQNAYVDLTDSYVFIMQKNL